MIGIFRLRCGLGRRPGLAEAASGHSEQAHGFDEAKCKDLHDPQVALCVFKVNYWSVLNNC